MRFKVIAIAAIAAVALSAPVFAELQNVEVGGEIRIRGNLYTDGSLFVTFDDDGPGLSGEGIEAVEQRTRINVTADFTDDVTTFIEIDNYGEWGNDTRQANPFGVNATPPGLTDQVNLYQAYIEMREAWGQPLTIRIGRQEVVLGNEWLVGNNDTAAFFTGLSFDGITARWDFDGGNVQAMYLKVAEFENSLRFFTGEQDGDSDLYGVYLTYDALEAVTLEGYVFYNRDASAPFGSSYSGIGGAGLPAFLGSGDDVGEFWTFGARAHGSVSGFDYDVQVAYQNGETAEAFFFFPNPVGQDLDIDAFAVDATVGYTFENVSNLYIWGGLAFFEGSDDPTDELSFLRMFSDVEYSEFLADSDLSNVLILRAGASIQATEAIEVSAVVSWFEADEDFSSDDEIGVELGLYASYDYSEDLNFSAGWAHFFADDGAEDGAALPRSGTRRAGGFGEDDDLDYFFFETSISF